MSQNKIFFFGMVLAFFLNLPGAETRAKACDKVPTGVEVTDPMISFQTENMPDPNLNGLDAQLRVHRIKPVYANGKCNGVPSLAVVLIHGRSVPGSPNFDLRHPTAEDPTGGALSLQETLAKAGIDTFAPDLLGYGLSSRLALDDRCNASLPAYVAALPDGQCPANTFQLPGGCCPVAEGCDRTRNAIVFPLNRQAASPVGLGINPGEPLCSHTSSRYFANPDVFARDILQTIDFAITEANPMGHKIVLLGYSFGGASTARTLYLLGEEAGRKVRRAVFMSSVFNLLPGPGGVPIEFNLPTEEDQLPPVELSTSFPLNLDPVGGWAGVTPAARNSFCTGRVIPNTPVEYAEQTLDLDPLLGALWGGSVSGTPTGLLRSPAFTLYGWNRDVAATFTLPTLVLHGADDTASPRMNSDNIFNALTSVTNKLLVQVECGSHQFLAEGCSEARCNDGDPGTTPYGQAPDPTGQTVWKGPYSTVAAALIEWVKYGTFDGSKCGHFIVNPSGVANEVATPNCPAP